VDKDGDRRHLPKINSTDEQSIRLANGTTQVQNAKDTSSAGGKIKLTESQIIINDGTNDRVLIGYLQNGF
jgi:hypothetical protein